MINNAAENTHIATNKIIMIINKGNCNHQFYLKKVCTFHPPVIGEENVHWDFIIEVPHWLLIVLHGYLQKWTWGTLRHILEHYHRQESTNNWPRLHRWNLWIVTQEVSFIRGQSTPYNMQIYLQGSCRGEAKGILVKLDHESIQCNLCIVLEQ